jgi:squalene-hopene/tetraprenyl-beta-curcumene cyclase
MLVPLSIINHFKPTRHLGPRASLNELFPLGFHERDLTLPRDPQFFTFRNLCLWVDDLHKFAEHFARYHVHPFRKRALKKSEEWMIARFEGTDGLAAIFPGVLNSMIALKALDYPDDHPLIRQCEQELKKLQHETDHTVRIEPCTSPVWDSDCSARIRFAERSSGFGESVRMAY